MFFSNFLRIRKLQNYFSIFFVKVLFHDVFKSEFYFFGVQPAIVVILIASVGGKN